MPLIMMGVRQCGKTYALLKLGREHYKNTAYFNFEDDPRLNAIFEPNADPERIIRELVITGKTKIVPGDTLVIFDEIQFCNRALTSLKYFCENARGYHIACAGSLLGLMLSKPYSFPVGKVNMIHMRPMCFKEFLLAVDEDADVEYIDGLKNNEKVLDIVDLRLKHQLAMFAAVGGMPAAVKKWAETTDIVKVDKILSDILESYRQDFAKHASECLPKLTEIWESIPNQLARDNNRFVFGHVKTGYRAKDLEDSLRRLIDAGIVHKVRIIDKPAVPLSTNASAANFKIYLTDIGLLRRLANLPPNYFTDMNPVMKNIRRSAAENLALCELLNEADGGRLYCWRSGNKAEVDFVAQIDYTVIPIEVKAGNDNRSKSLREYAGRYSPALSVYASMGSLKHGDALNLPLYMLWKISDYVPKRADSD
jgi:predicted AAA+ superfamily ATPase